MGLPSQYVCLEACDLNNVVLYLHSAEELLPVAKSCPKDNWQALETEHSATSFCASLQ